MSDLTATPLPNDSADEPSTMGRVLTLGALLIGALLTFHGLGTQPLWSDEANTALFGRNLLAFGELTAWDGVNLIGSPVVDEFDENLINTYLPPQQYYAAALGIGVFGESPFGARVVFAAMGIATIALTGLWARRYFGSAFPAFLPVLLLALCPAYLLLIRNCRYYALGVFWTVLLFTVWTAIAGGAGLPARPQLLRSPRSRTIAMHLLGSLAVIGLFTCQYINAVAALGVLPVFFLDRRFRSRRQWKLLATLYVTGLCCVVWVVSRGLPGETLLERHESVPGWARNVAVLSWWQVRDMGFFEFFAWPAVLLLALPWLHPKLGPFRSLAARGWVLLAVFGAGLLLIAVVSPQKFSDTGVAAMRYAVPLIAVGAMIGGAGLVILWKTNRIIALVFAAVLLGTNAFHLGSHRGQVRHDYYGSFPVRSTLLDYVRGNLDPTPSTDRKIAEVLETLPDGSSVWTSPFGLGTSAMFALPRLHYCGQIRNTANIRSELAVSLPDYVLWSAPLPDVAIVLAHKIDLYENGEVKIDFADQFLKERVTQIVGTKKYGRGEFVPTYGITESRPEIPSHLFWKPRDGSGHAMIAWILRKE